MRGKVLVVAVVAALVGGCGAQDVPQGSSPSPAAPSAAVGSIPVAPLTTAPPNGPTDQIKKTAWVVGTVTRDSSGPCYGLETDEGTQYALYAADATKLVKGQRMRIKTAPKRNKMYCGPGTPAEMISAEPLR